MRALLLLAAAACTPGDYGTVAFQCGVGDLCPSGYACDPSDNMCHKTPFAILPDSGNSPTADGGTGPDGNGQAPQGDTCSNPDLLTAATDAPLTTAGMTDDYALSCTGGDSLDRVERFTLGAAQAVLVTITPAAPVWPIAAALRADAICTSGANEQSCVAGAFSGVPLYINQPNLPQGTWDVIVDGAPGTSGGYRIRYDAAAVDGSFGYWRLVGTGTYTALSGGTAVPGFVTATDSGSDPNNGAADEAAYAITLPFSFDFYGTRYTTVNVHTNNFLSFAAITEDSTAYTIDCPLDTTTPLVMIAPFWTDAYAVTGATLTTKVEGTAPNRRFTVEWAGFENLEGAVFTGTRFSNQAVLYENGDIELRYGPRTAATDTSIACPNGGTSYELGCHASMGLRSDTPAQVKSWECQMPNVTAGTVVTFVHPR